MAAVQRTASHRARGRQPNLYSDRRQSTAPKVTSFNPPLLALMRPLMPVLRVISRVPEAVVPVTTSGAMIGLPVLAVTGLLTSCVPSFQLIAP